jgi:hypothetical protein
MALSQTGAVDYYVSYGSQNFLIIDFKRSWQLTSLGRSLMPPLAVVLEK